MNTGHSEEKEKVLKSLLVCASLNTTMLYHIDNHFLVCQLCGCGGVMFTNPGALLQSIIGKVDLAAVRRRPRPFILYIYMRPLNPCFLFQLWKNVIDHQDNFMPIKIAI